MTLDTEQRARIEDAKQQAERVAAIHARMLRGQAASETDVMVVRRLIRLLVEAWV